MPYWNEHFAVAAVEPLDPHHPLPPGTHLEVVSPTRRRGWWVATLEEPLVDC